MKIEVIKQAGGMFVPVDEFEHEKTTKFKTGEQYEIEIKLRRNPKFHGKVFKFFSFTFNYWASDREHLNEPAQRDLFRKQLTILAGFYKEYYNIRGDVCIEAESLSFSSMSQERFEQVYSALINAAIAHIFKGCHDPNIENQLIGFFS